MGGITSKYGWRYINGVRNFHNGLDFGWLNADITGSRKVYSAAPGVVVDAGYGSEPGNYVLVDIGNNYKVRYIHLASDAVTVGQRVGYSTFIGTMGDTGTATSRGQIHLHLDLYSGSTRVDPEPHLTLPFGYTGNSLAGGGTTPIVPELPKQDTDMPLFIRPNIISWPNGYTSTYDAQVWEAMRKLQADPTNPAYDWVASTWVREAWIAAEFMQKKLVDAVVAAIPSGTSGGAPTAAENAAAVEQALADNFARLPGEVNNDLKNRL